MLVGKYDVIHVRTHSSDVSLTPIQALLFSIETIIIALTAAIHKLVTAACADVIIPAGHGARLYY